MVTIFIKRDEREAVITKHAELVEAMNSQVRLEGELRTLSRRVSSWQKKVETLSAKLDKEYRGFKYPPEPGYHSSSETYWEGYRVFQMLETEATELKEREAELKKRGPVLEGELEALNKEIDSLREFLGEYDMFYLDSDLKPIPQPRRPSGIGRFEPAIGESGKKSKVPGLGLIK